MLKTILNRHSALAYLVVPFVAAFADWYRNRDSIFAGISQIPIYIWLLSYGGIATWILLFILLWRGQFRKHRAWLIIANILLSPLFFAVGVALWIPAECVNFLSILRGEYMPCGKRSVLLIIIYVLTAVSVAATCIGAVKELRMKQFSYSKPESVYQQESTALNEKVISYEGDSGVFVCRVNMTGGTDCVYMVQEDDGWHIAQHLKPRLFKNPDERVPVGTYLYYSAYEESKEVALIIINEIQDRQGHYRNSYPYDNIGSNYELIRTIEAWPGRVFIYAGFVDVDSNEYMISIAYE